MSLDMAPLDKMVLLVIGMESGWSSEGWQQTRQSIDLVGCSRRSFYSSLKDLGTTGYLSSRRGRKYGLHLPRIDHPVCYPHCCSVFTSLLPYKEKMVMMALACYMNTKSDLCWPSRNRLCCICGMGNKSLCRVLDILKQKGFVQETLVGTHPGFKVNLAHLKATIPSVKIDSNSAKTDVKSAKIAVESAKMDQFGGVKSCGKPTTTTVSSDEESSEHIITYKEQKNILPGAKNKGVFMVKRIKKAEEVFKVLAEKKDKVYKGNMGTQLGAVWKECLVELDYFPTQMKVPLTAKDRGQLQLIAKSFGANAIEKFRYMLLHWPDAALYVKEAVGAKTTPSKPHIGYVLSNVTYFGMFYAEMNTQETSKSHGPAQQKQLSHKMDDDEYSKKMAEWFKDE